MSLAPPSWGDLGVIASVVLSALGITWRLGGVETKVNTMYKWFEEKIIGGGGIR